MGVTVRSLIFFFLILGLGVAVSIGFALVGTKCKAKNEKIATENSIVS